MRKLTFTLIVIFAGFIAKAQNSIPNGNFESWTTNQCEKPQYYETSNSDFIIHGLPAACEKSTDAYHGSYAVKLITQHQDGMAYFGNFRPSGPPPWNGGMPYNQQATGLKGYFKSNLPAGDTALILVNFSKAGTGIGTYYTTVTGVNNSYIPFSFTFNPPLPQAPDSVIFFCTSSNPLGSTTPVVGNYIILDSISFTGVSSQPATFNGDFELWENETITTINNWSQQGGTGTDLANPTTDKVDGNYAVELISYLADYDGNMRNCGQTISTGYWDDSCDCQRGGYPFSNQVDTLAFWYKYAPSSNDTALYHLTFKKNGSSIYDHGGYLNAASSYQHLEIPFNLPQAPDTVIIEFSSSIWSDSLPIFAGSNLKIDEVHFKSQPLNTGVFSKTISEKISVYPNPGKGVFTVQSNTELSKIEVSDEVGRIVYSDENKFLKTSIDLRNYPKGVYFYKAYKKSGSFTTGKIIIE